MRVFLTKMMVVGFGAAAVRRRRGAAVTVHFRAGRLFSPVRRRRDSGNTGDECGARIC